MSGEEVTGQRDTLAAAVAAGTMRFVDPTTQEIAERTRFAFLADGPLGPDGPIGQRRHLPAIGVLAAGQIVITTVAEEDVVIRGICGAWREDAEPRVLADGPPMSFKAGQRITLLVGLS